MPYTVGEVARIAHVSVRTLHHYDHLGILRPSERTHAGYRLYTDADLATLQQALFYRELGFSLDEIRDMLADPAFDRREALLAQRELVAAQAQRYEAMLGLIDKTLISLEGGAPMTKEEMFEVFGDFDPAEYEEEVQQRWGDTDAYKESAKRTARYSKADWARFKAESEANGTQMISLFDQGVPPTDPRAMDVADEARLLIDSWFYPLSRAMHVNLAEMYLADPRFTAHYEDQREGLAQWWRDAIVANAERA